METLADLTTMTSGIDDFLNNEPDPPRRRNALARQHGKLRFGMVTDAKQGLISGGFKDKIPSTLPIAANQRDAKRRAHRNSPLLTRTHS